MVWYHKLKLSLLFFQKCDYDIYFCYAGYIQAIGELSTKTKRWNTGLPFQSKKLFIANLSVWSLLIIKFKSEKNVTDINWPFILYILLQYNFTITEVFFACISIQINIFFHFTTAKFCCITTYSEGGNRWWCPEYRYRLMFKISFCVQ